MADYETALKINPANADAWAGRVWAHYGKQDYYNSPIWKHTKQSEFDVSKVTKLPRVDVVFVSVDGSPDLIDCVRVAVETAGFSYRDIVSGAAHDSVYIARVAPTTMIFVPSRGGISHNEAEWTSFEQCAAGAQVMLNAVLEYDRRLG